MSKENNALGSIENPIKCNGIGGERDYLDKIVTAEGNPIFYHRKGSSVNSKKQILDIYIIKDMDGNYIATLHFDMYHEGYREKKVPVPFKLIHSFKAPKTFQKMDYFYKRKKEIFGEVEVKSPNKYVYFWSKSGVLFARGAYVYATDDAFGYPLDSMPIAEMMKMTESIVHNLDGIHPLNPIFYDDPKILADLLRTFHFDVDEEKLEQAKINTQAFSFKHIMYDDVLELYLNRTIKND